MAMQYRRLGRSGLKVSEIALGVMPLGGLVDEGRAIDILNRAFEAGITLFDLADMYHAGRCEEIVGKALKGWPRDAVVILTKVGSRVGDGPYDLGLSRKHILSSIEGSLRRLQTDYVDIYLAHRPDPNTPIEETLAAMDDLVRAGKVRYIGCSNYLAWEVCRALWASKERNLARFDCVEPRYNLVTRWIEQDLIPLCAGEGLGIIAYNPLAGGLLTGKYSQDSAPAQGTRFAQRGIGDNYRKRYWHERNFAAVAKLGEVARECGHTLAQVAMAWVLRNRAVSAAIVGVTSAEQLAENLSALEIAITEEEVRACDGIWEAMLPEGWLDQMGEDVRRPQ